jgi:hypothetical protein
MKKIRRFKGKEDIFENSEFTCYCKIVSSGKFLQVRLIIIIKRESIHVWYPEKYIRSSSLTQYRAQ